MQRGADLLIGRVLDGRYRIAAKVARGGMATVYRAHDLRLNRECAVKVMHSDLGDDHDFAARFVREAHSAARLSHPNLVAVTDQGDDDGVLFLVMEYVAGRTLREVIREEAPMRPERALALLEPVLRALAEAHRSRLVHRDVKPENVLIADDGRVKVADFGLARAFDANTTSTATGGLLIGTISYLAPELIVSGRADARSDVYAAGVLLFEMLTGRKPHEGESAIQVAFKHVNEDVPAPSSVTDHALPAYLDALVLRATARERERRPADAKVFLQQVRRVRAAVEAGDLEDQELTADLLPVGPSWVGEPYDYVDDPEATLESDPEATLESEPVASTRVDETPVAAPLLDDPLELMDDPTRVIGPAVAAAARPRLDRAGADPAADRPGGRAGTRTAPRPGPAQPGRPSGGVSARSGAGGGRPARPGGGRPARPGGGGSSPARPGAPGGASRPARPGRPADRRGPLLLVLVVALTVLAAYTGWWIGIGRYTSTPGVVNLPLAAATEKAEAAGLGVEVAERKFSETVTAGSVISTDPGAGSRILDGGTVGVVVSKGPERYGVPALAKKPLGEAEAVLGEVNLELGEVKRVWSEKVERGIIISTDPKAGTELRRGDTVDITVSKGREPIKIVDHTGRTGEGAEEKLTELGFTVEVTEENSAEVAKGRVISQSPDKGTGYRGDTVELVVSKGPVMVKVPDARTMSVAEATAALEKAGFEVEVKRTDLYISLDRVVRQSPGAGKSVAKGSTVTISIV